MRPSSRKPPALPIALALLLAGALAAALPARADDVYLANGQVFEDVIARRDGDTVRIRLAHGEMGFPASWVARIEESETVLAEYLRRKASLERSPQARTSAAAWLDLARWARAEGFAEGAREAALRAAALDPRLDGLAPLLQAAGLALDPESGSWLTETELMVRRGYVRAGREWVPAAVLAERERAAEAARQEAARAARDQRLDQVITLLALSQLEEAREERAREAAAVYYPYGAPVAVFPGTFHPRPPHRDPHPTPPPPRHDRPPVHFPERHRSGFSYDALAGRQPGSIIPLARDPGAERGKH